MMSRSVVAIGTTGGGYLLSGGNGSDWRRRGPFLEGESVNSMSYGKKTGRLYAATHTDGVFISDDLGKKWKRSNNGLHIKKAWTIEIDSWDPSTVYAGTHYGHIFRSTDAGENWQDMEGLYTAPGRKEWDIDWGFRTVGHCVHTIRSDPNRKNRLYFVTSAAGPYRSDDGGEKWRLVNRGVMELCPAASAELESAPNIPKEKKATQLDEHLKQVHKCTHKLVVSKENVYQQNHCGVYFSTDSGDHWHDVSPGNNLRHGFPMVMLKRGNADVIFTIPVQSSCKKHNSCIQGKIAVYRTSGSGKDWQKLGRGLQRKVHTCVLRDAMAAGQGNDNGIYFGTTNGQVYGSQDFGESWSEILSGVERIQGVSTFAI